MLLPTVLPLALALALLPPLARTAPAEPAVARAAAGGRQPVAYPGERLELDEPVVFGRLGALVDKRQATNVTSSVITTAEMTPAASTTVDPSLSTLSTTVPITEPQSTLTASSSVPPETTSTTTSAASRTSTPSTTSAAPTTTSVSSSLVEQSSTTTTSQSNVPAFSSSAPVPPFQSSSMAASSTPVDSSSTTPIAPTTSSAVSSSTGTITTTGISSKTSSVAPVSSGTSIAASSMSPVVSTTMIASSSTSSAIASGPLAPRTTSTSSAPAATTPYTNSPVQSNVPGGGVITTHVVVTLPAGSAGGQATPTTLPAGATGVQVVTYTQYVTENGSTRSIGVETITVPVGGTTPTQTAADDPGPVIVTVYATGAEASMGLDTKLLTYTASYTSSDVDGGEGVVVVATITTPVVVTRTSRPGLQTDSSGGTFAVSCPGMLMTVGLAIAVGFGGGAVLW